MRDPYQVLDLPRTASPGEIKAAYRKLAKKYHPDAHAGDAAMQDRFHEITAAYALLREEPPREPDRDTENASKSRFGGSPFRRARRARTATAKSDSQHEADVTVDLAADARDTDAGNDFLTDLFGGIRKAGKRAFQARGEDCTYELSVSFDEAALGAKRRVRLPGGKTLEVRVPAGVEHAQQIRLKGQGGDGHGGGEAGDALIVVSIEPHKWFRRDGLDIHLDLPVTLREAVLGARVVVPTLHGPVELTVPEGSNTGTRLRLKGKGIQNQKEGASKAGDQYVTLSIRLPDKPDESLRKFLKTWRPAMVQNPREGLDEG